MTAVLSHLGRRGRVGLVVTDQRVTAVELTPSRPLPVVRGSGAVDLPVGAVQDGAVVDVDGFAAAVVELWGREGLGRRPVSAVGSHDSLVRRVELPPMARRDVRSALRFELADQLPFPVDDARIDSWELPPPDDGASVVQHLVTVVRAGATDRLAAGLRAAGLGLGGLDIPAFAATRVDRLAPRPDGDPATAVVVHGEGQLTVAVHVGGQVRFARTVHVTAGRGGDLGAALEAELSAIESHRDRGGPTATRADPVVEAVVATLEHHRSVDPGAAVSLVHVLGGPDDPLTAALAERSGLQVEVVAPLVGPDGSPLSGSEWIAAGHALRASGRADGPRLPTGLGPAGRSSSASERRLAAVGAVAGLVLGLGALALVGPRSEAGGDEVDAARDRVAALQAELAERSSEDAEATELMERERLMAEVRARSAGWPGILTALESGRPAGSTLVSVDAVGADPATGDPGSVRLVVEAPDTAAVEPWLELLSGVDGLSDPWLEVASAGDPDLVGAPSTFTIRAAVLAPDEGAGS